MTEHTNSSGPLPHWDLSNVYPGLESETFKQAVAEFVQQLDALDTYMAEHQIGSQADVRQDNAALNSIISGYLDRRNALLRLYRTLEAYVRSFVATDSRNVTAKRIESELDQFGPRLHQQDTRFQSWIGRLADKLPQILAHGGSAWAHTFYLKEAAEQSRYLMSEAEESLAAELGLSGSVAWSKLQSTICSQITVPFERGGQVIKMPITALQNLYSNPDPDVRRRAYEAELAAWESVREPLAAALNGVKGTGVTLNKRRGRVDALHQSLDQSRLDRETLETMLGAMQDSFPMFRRYLEGRTKQKIGSALRRESRTANRSPAHPRHRT